MRPPSRPLIDSRSFADDHYGKLNLGSISAHNADSVYHADCLARGLVSGPPATGGFPACPGLVGEPALALGPFLLAAFFAAFLAASLAAAFFAACLATSAAAAA